MLIIPKSASIAAEKQISFHVKGIKLCLTAEGLSINFFFKFTVKLNTRYYENSRHKRRSSYS